ncbi:hypothetical protein BO78DRAFT_152934 [Aspergillus sclerotiicarbonarius CBS 121057]|uniref:Uncharacterized protein n=1 Tax=Aspergillus sclerotiicarbonarius (strain CBS 121057 / IBT 28362) TaxID=1448318 RepID=A0A319E5D2_ASPSB|nr:hypothetical protein BO78DRAFT_152934 [Aspergillus sclerotiicarbonarius CBS 121057]
MGGYIRPSPSLPLLVSSVFSIASGKGPRDHVTCIQSPALCMTIAVACKFDPSLQSNEDHQSKNEAYTHSSVRNIIADPLSPTSILSEHHLVIQECLVRGLQGHPFKTWTKESKSDGYILAKTVAAAGCP